MFRDVIILPIALYVLLKGLHFMDGALNLGVQWSSLTMYSDLLCMPVILGSGLWLTRAVTQRPKLILPETMVWLTFAVVSLVFEVILPTRSAVYTADVLDVLCYAAGTRYYVWRQSAALGQVITA